MAKLLVSRASDEARNVLRQSAKLIIPIALAFVVLPGVIAELVLSGVRASGDTSAILPIVMLLFLLASLTGQMAIQAIALPSGQTTVGAVITRALKRLPAIVAAALLLVVPLIILLSVIFGRQLTAAMSAPSPEFLGRLMLVVLIVLLPVARFSMLTPVAIMEPGGPIRLLKRAWTLGQGSTFKLYGLVLLTIFLPLLLSFVATAVIGSGIVIALGKPQGWSVSTLLIALISQMASAAASVPLAVIFARIYAHLSGPAHADVTVPSSGT